MSDDTERSPASAGSHGDKCRCGLATRLVGDGCEHCNPATMIDILREQIADMRLTDEEREALELARSLFDDYKMSRLHNAADEVLERLLKRLT